MIIKGCKWLFVEACRSGVNPYISELLDDFFLENAINLGFNLVEA